METTPIYRSRKVVVVGAGAVGSTFCYALAQSGLADRIVLIDRNTDLARGQVLDLAHGQAFIPPVQFDLGQPDDYADAQVVVVAAGAGQRPGEPRLELLRRNAAVIESIVDDIVARQSPAVLVVVSNPVDVLTHVAIRRAGMPRGRVLGSGTVLDSARLRQMLSAHCDIDPHNVHAYVLGEHGDSEFVAWSMAHVAGVPLDEYCPACRRCADWKAERVRIEQEVRESAYHIIGYKGATYYAVGLALVRIVGAILRGQRTVLTVSTLLDGEYGLSDVCLSVPCIVTENGVERVLQVPLTAEEMNSLRASAEVLKQAGT